MKCHVFSKTYSLKQVHVQKIVFTVKQVYITETFRVFNTFVTAYLYMDGYSDGNHLCSKDCPTN